MIQSAVNIKNMSTSTTKRSYLAPLDSNYLVEFGFMCVCVDTYLYFISPSELLLPARSNNLFSSTLYDSGVVHSGDCTLIEFSFTINSPSNQSPQFNGDVNKADLMAKQKHREPIWKAVPRMRTDGSAFHKSSYISTEEAKQQDQHFEDDCVGGRKRKRCVLTSVFPGLALSYCNEESDNYGNELRVENGVHIRFVNQRS